MPRHKQFVETDVVDRAMDVFWRHGYDGASIAELTKAMNVTAPSIYSTFGSKRGLFDAVMARYSERRAKFKTWMTEAPTAREMTERLLFGSAEWMTDPSEPAGCLSVQAGVSAGVGNGDVPVTLAGIRSGIRKALVERYTAAAATGELPASTDADSLSRFYDAIFHGMSLQAAAGATRENLEQVATIAMRSWPLAKVM